MKQNGYTMIALQLLHSLHIRNEIFSCELIFVWFWFNTGLGGDGLTSKGGLWGGGAGGPPGGASGGAGANPYHHQGPNPFHQGGAPGTHSFELFIHLNDYF